MLAAVRIEDADLEPVELTVETVTTSAWVDPYGRFYSVPFAAHMEWADRMNETYPDLELSETDPVGSLEGRGWLHMSGGCIWPFRFKTSGEQADTLYEIIRLLKVRNGEGDVANVHDLLKCLKRRDRDA